MTDKIVVLSTSDSEQQARRIARALVEKRLAACVNIVAGARSVYRWQGKIEEAGEYLLIIKSRRDLFDSLRRELERVHGYDVPEAIAMAVAEGSPAYLAWLERELG